MTTELPDAPLVVAAFLARYYADQEDGAVQPREQYEALFPGFADVVAAEFDRLQVEGQAQPEAVEGQRLAGYRIERELGRGGQGIVYLAEDEQLGRKVALKVLPGAFTATVARQRLLREAQAASRLDDPGICTVYDAGEEDGVAYIAMQFVAGESLHDRIASESQRQPTPQLADPLRIKELLGVFEAALRSLHRAHEKGLVHRDIKPSNLMLSDDGTPRILDFGLAAFDDHPDGSLTGEVALGTPAYMSPEQLTVREGRVDARSDVFSFAVTCYEAIALQHPFAAPTRERLYQHILNDEAPPLKKLVPGLPRDLDVALQCALAKDRTRRYATALAFAEDLRAVRLGDPIRARKVTGVERTWRWAQRNPTVALLAAMLLVAVVSGVVTVIQKNQALHAALDFENQARMVAAHSLEQEQVARQRSDSLYLVGLANGQLQDDPELALLLARKARAQLDHHLTRSTLRRALEQWHSRPIVAGVRDPKWVVVDPTGARVAIPQGDQVVLIDSATRARAAAIACPAADDAQVWWSGDGSRLLIAQRNRVPIVDASGIVDGPLTVELYGVDGKRIAELPGHRGRLTAVDFDDNWIATGDRSADPDSMRPGVLSVWSLKDGAPAAPTFHLEDCRGGVQQVRFHGNERAGSWPDLELLARDGLYRRLQGGRGVHLDERRTVARAAERLPDVFLGEYGYVYVDHGELLQKFWGRAEEAPQEVAVPPGRRQWSRGVRVISRTSNPTTLRTIDTELEFGRLLALPPREIVHLGQGRRLLVKARLTSTTETTFTEPTMMAVFTDGSIRVFGLSSNTFEELPPLGAGVTAASCSSNGEVVAVIDGDGHVRVFPLPGGSVLPSWNSAEVASWEALHPDGRRVLSFSREDVVLVDLATGQEAWAWEFEDRDPCCVAAWASDGERFAVGDTKGNVAVLRVGGAEPEVLFQLPVGAREVRRLTFDPSGEHLLVLRERAEVWSTSTQKRVHAFDDVDSVANVHWARAERDGDRIVLSSTQGFQLRTFPDGELLGATAEDPWRTGVASVRSAGVVLMTGYHDGYRSRFGGNADNALLDVRTGSLREVPGGEFGCGGLSPDGRLVVLSGADGSLQLFDCEQNEVVRVVRGHDGQINRVRFSRDGQVFATAKAASSFPDSMDDRRVCVWSRDGELLQQLDFGRDGVSWFDVSADGAWVVVKTNNRELRRYPVDPIKMVENLQLREITAAERERFELK